MAVLTQPVVLDIKHKTQHSLMQNTPANPSRGVFLANRFKGTVIMHMLSLSITRLQVLQKERKRNLAVFTAGVTRRVIQMCWFVRLIFN